MQFLSIFMLIIGLLGGGYWWVQQELSRFNHLYHPHLSEMQLKITRLQQKVSQFTHVMQHYDEKWHSSIAPWILQLDHVQQEITALKTSLSEQPTHHHPDQDKYQALTQTLNVFSDELQRLRNDLTQFQNDVMSHLSRTVDQIAQSHRNYHTVNLDLGTLPVGKNRPLIYTLHDAIPDTAREILVYVYIETNYVKGGRHHFKIAVTLDNDQEAAFYLYATAHAQQSWSYNSENAWLPMPMDRQIKISSEGETLFGNWISGIRIVAYR